LNVFGRLRPNFLHVSNKVFFRQGIFLPRRLKGQAPDRGSPSVERPPVPVREEVQLLRNVSEIINYQLVAEDGEIGKCKDFLFDDEQWTIRYMVADTSRWLPGRKVLISPLSLGYPQWRNKLLPVSLTKEQIKESPPLEKDAPVSRKYEMQWADHYSLPYYWPYMYSWGIEHYPVIVRKPDSERKKHVEDPNESHLRSTREVTGYDIQALDDAIGKVEDFIIDDSVWSIRYLVVDTRKWLPGRKVLISSLWVQDIDWSITKVFVDKNRKEIEESPEYHPEKAVNLEYEARLYDFYGRPL